MKKRIEIVVSDDDNENEIRLSTDWDCDGVYIEAGDRCIFVPAVYAVDFGRAFLAFVATEGAG